MAGEHTNDTAIYDDRPLHVRRLAAIRRGLADEKYWRFLGSLRSDIAVQLLQMDAGLSVDDLKQLRTQIRDVEWWPLLNALKDDISEQLV